MGAWLRVWHLRVDAEPQQAQKLGWLPPVWASRVHQPHRDLKCGPSAWRETKLEESSMSLVGTMGRSQGKELECNNIKIRGKREKSSKLLQPDYILKPSY